MRRDELEHLLRAAGAIADEDTLIVVIATDFLIARHIRAVGTERRECAEAVGFLKPQHRAAGARQRPDLRPRCRLGPSRYLGSIQKQVVQTPAR